MRLGKAGGERELFASAAVAMLPEGARVALREVDRLATEAMSEAARRKKKLVERDTVSRVLDTAPRRAVALKTIRGLRARRARS